MDKKFAVVETETLFKGWGRLTRTLIDYFRNDGSVDRLAREMYDHGDGAAILLHDPDRKTLLLVRQFRFPVAAHGDNPFVLEVCAGLVEGDTALDNPFVLEVCAGLVEGDTALDCARREALEETGHEPQDVTHILDIYMSPGSLKEKTALFLGRYGAHTYRHAGGGLAHEGEEIEVVELGIEEAFGMLARGEITDGKTVVLIQHLKLMLAQRP